jgi:hypothetical protein
MRLTAPGPAGCLRTRPCGPLRTYHPRPAGRRAIRGVRLPSAVPKPQPNGSQLGKAQPGTGFWPWRDSQRGQVCAGAQLQEGRQPADSPRPPAAPASSRAPGAPAPSLTALERTRSTAVHEAALGHSPCLADCPCCLSEAPRRRPPEPQFGRRCAPLPSGGARGHARAHRHARKKARPICWRLEVLCRNLYEEQHAVHAGCWRGSPAATVDHPPADLVPAAQCRSNRVGPSSMRCVRSEYSEHSEYSEPRVRRRRRVVGYPQAVHRRLHAAALKWGCSPGYSWGYSEGTPGVLRGYSRGY